MKPLDHLLFHVYVCHLIERNMKTHDMSLVLSAIFRPVTMISPDVLIVIQVHLQAYGFPDFKVIYLIIKTRSPLPTRFCSNYKCIKTYNFLIMTFLKLISSL